jgi:hypothetical protein
MHKGWHGTLAISWRIIVREARGPDQGVSLGRRSGRRNACFPAATIIHGRNLHQRGAVSRICVAPLLGADAENRFVD